MVKKELDVFLSSDQKEFAKLRNSLAKKLRGMPFLACTPIENRGADPTDVVEASLRAVEKSDIYVGIFGHKRFGGLKKLDNKTENRDDRFLCTA